MFVELHMLQNFPPSCLNRDDTNAPKDCEFGGYRRARISSQCLKRSIRQTFNGQGYLKPDNLATRSRQLIEKKIVPHFVEQHQDEDTARKAATAALLSAGFGVNDGESSYLLFFGQQEIDGLLRTIKENWDQLVKAGDNIDNKGDLAKKHIPSGLPAKLHEQLDGGKAADVGLFGRMLADLPNKNVDAAAQVAHALSTNRISMEMDFYTAVDELQTKEDESGAGAAMMGTIEFNSACFYRYANIDLDQLTHNLSGDVELARQALDAFLRASIDAIPTGKQTTMAAQNPPSMIFAVARERGLWSLANAFAKPVHPDREKDLIQKSTEALDDQWGRMARVYGEHDIEAKAICLVDDADLKNLSDAKVDSVEALVDYIKTHAQPTPVEA